jgi:hypothetical protein
MPKLLIRVKTSTAIGGNGERHAGGANLAKENTRDGGAGVR